MTFLCAAILAVSTFASSLHTLVLQSGEQIALASEDVKIQEGLVVFRADSGSLYSIPLGEIDLEATESINVGPQTRQKPERDARTPDHAREYLERLLAARSLSNIAIVVSDDEKARLLDEVEKSRGTPTPPAPLPATPVTATPAGEAVTVTEKNDEWYWRDKAREHKERVRQAKEEMQFLIKKEQRLQDEILGFLSLGYSPNQFSLQVFQLTHTRDSIPRAQMNVERVERSYRQFREDARRQGILPGWLR